MQGTSEPSNGNRLLAALSPEEHARLAPHLELVPLALGQILFRPEDRLDFAHFPITAIVSLLTELEDGTGMEVGLVGREGVAGVSAFLGGTETKVATVQGEGEGLRIRAAALREEFARGGTLQSGLLHYTHALMAQISQSAVCNVRHPLPGRLARWLLMYHDRLRRDEFDLTHEFMANMLGVRRAGVTEVAAALQQAGFINYQRGHIRILNREGLEDYACECYPVVREKFDDLLP
jgi:CRP-like cAMP-binding protein